MTRLRKLTIAAVAVAAALAAAPASAAAGCKEGDPHPGCLPRCPLYVDVDPGDPLNGIPPTVTVERIPC